MDLVKKAKQIACCRKRRETMEKNEQAKVYAEANKERDRLMRKLVKEMEQFDSLELTGVDDKPRLVLRYGCDSASLSYRCTVWHHTLGTNLPSAKCVCSVKVTDEGYILYYGEIDDYRDLDGYDRVKHINYGKKVADFGLLLDAMAKIVARYL